MSDDPSRLMPEFRTGDYGGPIRVTITDPKTGEVMGEKVVENDYVLITVGRRYLKSMQVWGRTHQLNIAWDADSDAVVEP